MYALVELVRTFIPSKRWQQSHALFAAILAMRDTFEPDGSHAPISGSQEQGNAPGIVSIKTIQ